MPADRRQRQRAIDPGASFIVQAPAGSGKTEVLTQRFLSLLATVERPERVLAITFTRKATQEMRKRISGRLAQAEAGADPDQEHDRLAVALAARVLERDRQLGWNLLHNPGRLRISTIDGLCAQLLSRDPVEGPRWHGVQVLEDARRLYREAVGRLFADVDELAESEDGNGKAAQDALVRMLVRVGGDARRLQGLLVDMLQRRSLWERHIRAGHEALAALLDDRQARALAEFRSALGEAELDEAMAIASRLGVEIDKSEKPDGALRAAFDFASRMTKLDGKPWAVRSLKSRVFAGIDPAQSELFERFCEIFAQWCESEPARLALESMAGWPPLDIVPEADEEVPGAFLDDVRSVLWLAVLELRNLMAETGQADFTAIAEAAFKSLGGDEAPGEALLAEDARIDHILMDEFQDSSHAQFRLLCRLIDGWQAGDGRSLFLVGDPMQSIYRFREANVGFFNEVVRLGRLGQVAVEPLQLTSNFRSRGELVDWFNRVFPTVFSPRDEPDSGAVAYTPVSGEQPTGGQVSLHAITPGNGQLEEADKAAELIKAARRDLGDPSIAILVRSREQVPRLTAGLTRHGVDFEAVEIGRLADRGAIQDLMILARALMHPLDRVAWIALLRAPCCGLSVADLHHVVGEDSRQEVRWAIEESVRERRLDSDALARLRRLSAVMARARQRLSGHSLAECVQMCWIELGGPLCCADAADLDNAESFLDLLEEVEQGGRHELIERLEEALVNRFASSRPARVQIMTIHKAKGLEFDVVIVPGLERCTPGTAETLIALQEFSSVDGSGGVLMAPVTPRSVAEISLYRYLNRVDAERNRFEDQRVLYVACTRACRRLHLLASPSVTASGKVPVRSNSFLKLLEEPFQAELEAAADCAVKAVPEPRAGEPPAYPLLRLKNTVPFPEPAQATDSPTTTGLRRLPRGEAVALGTVLHRWLELIHDHPEPGWDAARIEHSGDSIRDSLKRAGAPPESLEALQALAMSALLAALNDAGLMAAIGPLGQGESWSELALYRRDGMHFSRHVIDLLLRDLDGALRIVDYKTGNEETGTAENAEWQKQLDRYRALVERLDAGPVSDATIKLLRGAPAPLEKV